MGDKAGETAKAPVHATLNSPKVFKSGHMNAMKSMSLMNDLQVRPRFDTPSPPRRAK